ncbi:hypothetical protein Sango_2482700 [Sesamum angolense]|uniref:Reverse transcriptase Ty1/copia-type domain-containing protein n=1 Tax=Sesamum angolense TaxID=2727404 RepID=A0AAE2BI26_9LAMI|nr:hypothetical protein Sango_2482700 [Sesamum angolense]
MSKNPLMMIMETNKFNDTNYNDWLWNLRNVLDFENRGYVLDKPLLTALSKGSSPEERITFKKWLEDNHKVRGIILASMTNDIQKQYDRLDGVPSIMIRMTGAGKKQKAKPLGGSRNTGLKLRIILVEKSKPFNGLMWRVFKWRIHRLLKREWNALSMDSSWNATTEWRGQKEESNFVGHADVMRNYLRKQVRHLSRIMDHLNLWSPLIVFQSSVGRSDRYGFLGLTSQLDNDPRTYGEAISDIDLDKWLKAMRSEMDSMGSNNHAKSIQILLAIAAYYDYEIWHMDVKIAFLNNFIEEEIYMDQPEVSLSLEKNKSEYNPCVYKKISGSTTAYLVLYVDDILLIRNDVKILGDIKA